MPCAFETPPCLFVYCRAIFLSVGAFCERPRANTVRPYRGEMMFIAFSDECRLTIRLLPGRSWRGTRLMRVAAKRRGTNAIESRTQGTSSVTRKLVPPSPRGRLKISFASERATNGRPYYIVTTKTLPARVILEWRTAALQILRYARE